jgi:hypothetical protein
VWRLPHAGSSNASGSLLLRPLGRTSELEAGGALASQGLVLRPRVYPTPLSTLVLLVSALFFSRSLCPPYGETRQGHNIQPRARSLHRLLPALVARIGSIHQQSGLRFNLVHIQRELLQANLRGKGRSWAKSGMQHTAPPLSSSAMWLPHPQTSAASRIRGGGGRWAPEAGTTQHASPWALGRACLSTTPLSSTAVQLPGPNDCSQSIWPCLC